ncbi:hypothetical protein GJ496_004256 [Pomphorhynchus laevis]|nr:hypothetical protein GJ496_004256 [Pomphorhynchus laevis]
MSKRGPMDKFIKSRQLVAEDTSNSEADDGVIETEVLPSKRIRTVFTRKYDSSYIQFGFVATNDGEVPKPLCVICGDVLANHSMKPSHLKRHLNTKHKEMSSKSKEFFARKHVDLKSRQKQIFKVSRTNTCALRASYKVALRVAKAKKPYTICETLVQGCIKYVCIEMLGEPSAQKVAKVPLSNDTIARRINELAHDMEDQLIEQIKLAKYYSLQLDECTDVANQAVLMVYVRYEHEGELKEEYFFSVSLPKNTTSSEVFKTIDGQKRKLEAWKSRVSKDCYDMFHLLATVIDDAGEELNILSLRKVIKEHLINLADRFQHYFPAEEDPRIGNGWIINPFIPLRDDFVGSVLMEDKLLDLAADEGLKRIFETSTSLASFWIKVKTEYSNLSEIALKTLLVFPTTYLCETGFSTMSVIKTKYRNCLDIHSPIRVALSSIQPRLSKLTNKKQAHPSH